MSEKFDDVIIGGVNDFERQKSTDAIEPAPSMLAAERNDFAVLPRIEDLEGVDQSSLAIYAAEFQASASIIESPDFSAVAYPQNGYSNQMENVSYDESLREFIGKTMSPGMLDELIAGVNELSEERREELKDFVGGATEIAVIASESNSPESHAARVSTISTSTALGELESVDHKESTDELSYWQKPENRKIQRLLATFITAVVAGVAAEPAFAGGRNRMTPMQEQEQYERSRVVNAARATGVNILFGVVQQALSQQGINVDGRGPVNIPGTEMPGYGGVVTTPPVYGGQMPPPPGMNEGYPMGGRMSNERISIEAKIIRDRERIAVLEAQMKEDYAKAMQT